MKPSSTLFQFILLSAICLLSISYSRAQTYCSPTFVNGCGLWHNQSITLGDINWTLGSSACTTTDYTSLSTTLQAGTPYPMTVVSGNWCGCAVWIDFDNSGTFDSTEYLYHIYVGGAPSYTYNFDITIPQTTFPGTYRMRVIAPWGSDGFTPGDNGWGGCGDYQYGNFDDFTIVVQNPDVCTNSYGELTATGCNYYDSPSGNISWGASGTYQDIIPNAAGCDSIITVNLTINYSTSSSLTASSDCGGYTGPSGTVYPHSGVFQDIIPNAAGCDSIITLNLTITSLDTAVTLNNGTLSAHLAGATYQWLNCDNNFAEIPGATAQSYHPTAIGNYAVRVTSGNCSQISGCHQAGVSGTDEANNTPGILAFPNPASNLLTVAIQEVNLDHSMLYLLDVSGKTLLSQAVKHKEEVLDIAHLPNGMYLLKYQNVNGIQTIRIVK